MREPVRETHLGDGIAWLGSRPPNSAQALVTDPPYGAEYQGEHVAKMRRGSGGNWRQPPTLNGCRRKPKPRFTVVTPKEAAAMREFFDRMARAAFVALVPGAHVILAGTPILAHIPADALAAAGFQRRGALIRLVRAMRGGDRPKGFEAEFAEVDTMARGCWEPWIVFRKPLDGTVAANLRRWGTGGLRRPSAGKNFEDVIPSGIASWEERAICDHQNLKPQAFMRAVVRAALPLGRGTVVDPFMGGGSTLAAAAALGYDAAGAEIDEGYYRQALDAIPRLAALRG